jgi:hypothetical protein
MQQRRVNSWWVQWTCPGGTCAPPAARPANGFERALDIYTGLTAPFLRGCWVFATVALVWSLTRSTGVVGGLVLQGAFFLIFATYCLANFERCREAHCIVTGIGWSVLAVISLAAATTGHDLRNADWITFLVVAVAGHGFEGVWKASRGSNALRL